MTPVNLDKAAGHRLGRNHFISSPRDLKKGSISGLSSPVKDLNNFIGSSDAPFSRNVFLNFMESSLSQTSPFFSKTEYR